MITAFISKTPPFCSYFIRLLMEVFRLIKTKYIDVPLSTMGAEKSGGRWNPKGFPILYTSATPELAALEVLVHLDGSIPFDELPPFTLLTITLPDEFETLTPDALTTDWRRADTTGKQICQEIIQPWLIYPTKLIMQVPSAIITRSFNYLVHGHHPLFNELKPSRSITVRTEDFSFDSRLWKRQ